MKSFKFNCETKNVIVVSLITSIFSALISYLIATYTISSNIQQKETGFIKDKIYEYLTITTHEELKYKMFRMDLPLSESIKQNTLLTRESYVKLKIALNIKEEEELEKLEQKHIKLFILYKKWANAIIRESKKGNILINSEKQYYEMHRKMKDYLIEILNNKE